MWAAAGTTDYRTALQTKQGARAITDWLLQRCSRNRLPQFSVAKDLHGAKMDPDRPLQRWWLEDYEVPAELEEVVDE